MSKDKAKKRWLFFGKDKYTYDTIEELINKSAGLAPGEIVTLNGYYSGDDGATHKRVIANEDDGSGVQLRSGLWANIVHDGEINIKWLGAKGTGELHIIDDSYKVKFPTEWLGADNSYSPSTQLTETDYAFTESDSIDTIAIQKAIWLKGVKDICIPSGKFIITRSLVMGKDFEKNIIGNSSNSIIEFYKSSSSDFTSKLNRITRNCILNFYRSSGTFKNIKNLRLQGEYNHSKGNGFKIFDFQNVNGVYFDNIFTTANDVAFNYSSHCSDIFMRNITSEYSFDTLIKITGTDNYIHMSNLNLWQSQKNIDAKGIVTDSELIIKNSQFVGFGDSIIDSKENLIIDNCIFSGIYSLGNIVTPKKLIMCNCFCDFGLRTPFIKCGSYSIIENCNFKNSGVHSFVNVAKFENDLNINSELKNNYLEFTASEISSHAGRSFITSAGTNYTNGSEKLKVTRCVFKQEATTDVPVFKINNSTFKENIYVNTVSIDEVENPEQELNTLYMGEKMQQEGVYEDFISYMDDKTAYDKEQRENENQKQLAYEEALKENLELTYEQFIESYPVTVPLIEEPKPSEKLKSFMDKYL